MANFTFKTVKPTGKWKSFSNPAHYVKLNGKTIGNIDAETYRIRVCVIKKDINEDGNPNCEWKWVKLIFKPTSLEDAKRVINENSEKIQSLNLYFHEQYGN